MSDPHPRLARIMADMEAGAEALGWGQCPSILFTVTHRWKVHLWHLEPGSLIAGPALEPWPTQPVHAVGYLCEAWMVKHPNKADAKAFHAAVLDGTITDAPPDHIDIRVVAVLDCHTNMHHLFRRRGGPAELYTKTSAMRLEAARRIGVSPAVTIALESLMAEFGKART